MKAISRIMLAMILLASILVACGTTGEATQGSLDQITVQLRWTHQAQFAGFYAADQNGYYADEGLAVTFLEGGPTADLLTPVLSDTAQFGVAGADTLVLGRASGQPVRAIATIFRRSPIVFVTLSDSGIIRPQDFVGKEVRVTVDTAPVFHAMMARVGISPEQYTEVNIPNDITVFASGEPPVWSAFITGFVVNLQQAGYELNFIFPDDYGVHFYADTIFATDDIIVNNPDLVQRFLRATLRGWTYAIENPTAVEALVAQYAPDADVRLQNAQMIASLPLINTGEDYIGWMKPEIWAGMEQLLREQSVLTEQVDVTQVYTLEFLQEIYP